MAIISQEQEILRLAQLAKSGDAPAFGELYDMFVRKIYDFVYYKTLNKEVAEDLTSIVFTKAWKNINQFSSDSFPAWLYAIGRRTIADYFRQKHDNLDIDDCWDLADNNDFLKMVDNHLQIDIIKSAIKDLKSIDREIIMLRFWQDLSFKEIAERLGRQEGAVKMSLSRALKTLRLQVPLVFIILGPNIINLWKKIN